MDINSTVPPAEGWPTMFKFVHPCGCGMDIDAHTTGGALLILIDEYESPKAHAHQGPVITGQLLKYPGVQVATVDINYLTGSVEWALGGPLFPCGDAWDYACAWCGEVFHDDLPAEHPNPPGDCAGHIHVCDDCMAKLERR